MSINAPLGIGWLPWHLQRIYNATAYLDFNGFFSSYGFTIWTKCSDCSLSSTEWINQIYTSYHGFSLLPYWILNYLGGREALEYYGPIMDKFVILVTAIVVSELIIKCVKRDSNVPQYFIGISCFVLFISNPWTYKMFLSAWFEIYFLMFFFLGLLSFSKNRNALACLFFLISGIFHPLWAFAILIFYLLVIFIPLFTKEGFLDEVYLPPFVQGTKEKVNLLFSLTLPVLAFFVIRMILPDDITQAGGSSLLARIGISGDDIHNGGLVGALQFLGGNRITLCLANYDTGIITNTLTSSIATYNCLLSIGSMAGLSILSVLGLVLMVISSMFSRWIIFPLAFALLLFIGIFQQSLSVHLMGYSYIFAFLFASGICGLMMHISKYMNSINLSIILSIPILVGIVITSIRVSMLTGLNG